MANALAFAFRRGFARAILVVGLGGFIWAVVYAAPDGPQGGTGTKPKPFDLLFAPHLVDRTVWDIPVAAAVLVLIGVLAALIWRARSTSRSS